MREAQEASDIRKARLAKAVSVGAYALAAIGTLLPCVDAMRSPCPEDCGKLVKALAM